MMRRPAGPVLERVPDGDTQARLVCEDCGFINYVNPKIVVGAVCVWEDQILLCRRAIDPRKGYWTLPAGYLELHEGTEEGARREAYEEAYARIELDGLLAVYALKHISQVQLIYRARLLDPDVSPGPETAEVALVRWQEVPWDDIAFPSVQWALHHHRAARDREMLVPATNPPGEQGRPPV